MQPEKNYRGFSQIKLKLGMLEMIAERGPDPRFLFSSIRSRIYFEMIPALLSSSLTRKLWATIVNETVMAIRSSAIRISTIMNELLLI
jgi:hypothetical protein